MSKETEIIAVVEAQEAGRTFLGGELIGQESSWPFIPHNAANEVLQYIPATPWVDPYDVTFADPGPLREARLVMYGSTRLAGNLSGTGGTLATPANTLTDAAVDFVATGVAPGDIVIPVATANAGNYQTYQVDTVAQHVLTFTAAKAVSAGEVGTCFYHVVRPAPVELYALPESNVTGTAFEEQTFVFNDGSIPDYADSYSWASLGTYFPGQVINGARNPLMYVADRADAVLTTPPQDHTAGGYRVILYPDDGTGTGPDLEKPILTTRPVIDPATGSEGQWAHISSSGILRLSHPPKSLGDFRPTVEAYTGRLKLYAIWFSANMTSSVLADYSQGLSLLRPADDYVNHPNDPGSPAEIHFVEEADLTGWVVSGPYSPGAETFIKNLDDGIGANSTAQWFTGVSLDYTARKMDLRLGFNAEDEFFLATVPPEVDPDDDRLFGYTTRSSGANIYSDLFIQRYDTADPIGKDNRPHLAFYENASDAFWLVESGQQGGILGAVAASVPAIWNEAPGTGLSNGTGGFGQADLDGASAAVLGRGVFFDPRWNTGLLWDGTLDFFGYARGGELGVRESTIVAGDNVHTRGDANMYRGTTEAYDLGRGDRVGVTAYESGDLESYDAGYLLLANVNQIIPGIVHLSEDGLKPVRVGTGGRVHLRKGIYWFDSTFQIPPGVRITGEGESTILQAAPSLGRDPLVRVAPFILTSPITTFPDDNVPSFCPLNGSVGSILNTGTSTFDGLGAATVYNARYDRMATVWLEVDAGGDPHLYFTESNLAGAGISGGPIELSVSPTKTPSLDQGPPSIDWHPLLNTYVISWIEDDGVNNHLAVELWDSLLDATADGRPGVRAGAADTLSVHTTPVADTLAGTSVKWMWGCGLTTSRRFMVAHVNDDASATLGGQTFHTSLVDVTESAPGLWDTITETVANDKSFTTAADIADSCDIVYSGSASQVYLIFCRKDVGGVASTDAVYQAVFNPAATNLAEMNSVEVNRHGDNVLELFSTWSAIEYGTEVPQTFNRVRAAYGHHEIQVVFANDAGWVFHAMVPAGSNANMIGTDLALGGVIGHMSHSSGTSWGLWKDADIGDEHRGPAFPSYHGGRKDVGDDGANWLLPSNIIHHSVGGSFRYPSIAFDGEDFILAYPSQTGAATAIVAVARVCGTTGDLLQCDDVTLFTSGVQCDSVAVAATPYRSFHLVSTDTSASRVWLCVAAGLRFRSSLESVCLVGNNADLHDDTSDYLPHTSKFLEMRNGTRATGELTVRSSDDFILSTGAATDTIGCASDFFSEADVGKRITTFNSVTVLNNITRRITGYVDAQNVTVEPVCLNAAAEPAITCMMGSVYDQRFGGPRIASNGYVTCMVSVLEPTHTDIGGDVSYMILKSDTSLDDINDQPEGGVVCYNAGTTKGALFADVVWTGTEFQIFALMYQDTGTESFYVQRLSVGASGKMLPTSRAVTLALADSDMWRRVTGALLDQSGLDTETKDIADFRVAYNGQDIGLAVFATDYTDHTIGGNDEAAVHVTVVTPEFIGHSSTLAPSFTVPENLALWSRLDELQYITGANYILGGDLCWADNHFAVVARFVDATGPTGRILFGGFRASDKGIVRTMRDIPYASSESLFQSGTLHVPTQGWFTVDGGGLGDPSRYDQANSRYRMSVAYNPIDRIYAIAYTGLDGSLTQDNSWTQVIVEYFEENGITISLNNTDTTATKARSRQYLYFGGRVTLNAGYAADSPVIIWTGSNFALTFRGFGVDAANNPVNTDAYGPLHILHPKAPGIVFSTDWEKNDGVAAQGYLTANQDMIYDPVTGDILMAGTVIDATIEAEAVSFVDSTMKPGVLKRYSPVHLIQIAGADSVTLKDITVKRAIASIRIDPGTTPASEATRLGTKMLASSGSDPAGMNRVMKSYKIEDINQDSCLFHFRLLNGRGIDDPDNLNMNGK